MKIALIHDSLNACGGAEKLALAMAKSLHELGHEVILVTLERTNWEKVSLMFGEECRKYFAKEVVLFPYRAVPTTYGRFVNWLLRDVLHYSMHLRGEYDLTIVTKQLHVPVFADILYMHFPDFYPNVMALYYPERYVHNIMLRAYSLPSHILSSIHLKAFRYVRYKPLILTNSSFSKAMIKRWLDANALVIHPPVDAEPFLKLDDVTREDIILTIGRIERMKNLQVVPFVASKTPNVRYVIVGSLADKSYYEHLLDLARQYGVDDRVDILVNASFDKMLDIFSKAKIYLHTTTYEHFGISVVEAMAAGLIPIVPKNSGTWIDIVKRGLYGYGYFNPMDVPQIIYNILRSYNTETNKAFRQKMRNSVFRFSSKQFKTKINIIVNKYIINNNLRRIK